MTNTIQSQRNLSACLSAELIGSRPLSLLMPEGKFSGNDDGNGLFSVDQNDYDNDLKIIPS